MRKITIEASNALGSTYSFNKSNTTIEVTETGAELRLHGNLIAEYDTAFKELTIYDAGYKTLTTKERINGILHYFNLGKIQQIKGIWYYIEGETKEEFEGEKTFSL